MKALSLWQPWSSAIALGHKTVETRGWSTRYRGPIAIHGAKRWTADERDWARVFAQAAGDERLLEPPLGCIVATATLAGVRPTEWFDGRIGPIEHMLGNYGPGRFGFLLEDVVALEVPIPWRGMQGMFEIPDDILHASK